MSNDRIRVNITSNQNSVEVTNTENKVIVTDKKQDTNVNVIQNETSVVTIVSKGPKGDRGEKGEQASLSGSVYITGSLEVSSSVTAQSFTGSLFGTSSWAQNALTASFITPTGTNAFVQGGNSFGTTALLGTNDNQDLQLETNGSVRMTISSSGRVGIGTTTPTSTLQVNGSITATNLTVTNGSVVATLSPIEGSTGLLLSSNDGSDTRIFTDSITTGINSSGSAPYASAYGSGSKAIGTASFSEGIGSLASGFAAHAAGLNTTASGQAAFSVGVETDADGMASFAAGSGSWARGTATVAMGIGTIASASGQTVVGHYNLGLGDFNNLFVVGGGSGITTNLRKNLFRVYGGSGASTVGVEINTSPTQNTSTIDVDNFNIPQNKFTLSFWMYSDDWFKPKGYQLLGNFNDYGVGFYNYNFVTPFIFLKQQGKIISLNRDFEQLNIFDSGIPKYGNVKYVLRRDALNSFHCITDTNNILEFDIKETLIDASSALSANAGIKDVHNDEGRVYVMYNDNSVTSFSVFTNNILSVSAQQTIGYTDPQEIIKLVDGGVVRVAGTQTKVRDVQIYFLSSGFIQTYDTQTNILCSFIGNRNSNFTFTNF